MVPRLVPEISSLDAFCDRAAAVGIGDSRSWIVDAILFDSLIWTPHQGPYKVPFYCMVMVIILVTAVVIVSFSFGHRQGSDQVHVQGNGQGQGLSHGQTHYKIHIVLGL